MRSLTAILFGLILAFAIALMVVFGIFAPILSVVFGAGRVGFTSALPAVLLAFATAFAFYWGGMAAGYRAASHRPLHGVLVGVVAVVLSPVINVLTGQGPFPRVDSPTLALLVVVVAVAAVGASYVGGRRGETLYLHNQQFARPKKPRPPGNREE